MLSCFLNVEMPQTCRWVGTTWTNSPGGRSALITLHVNRRTWALYKMNICFLYWVQPLKEEVVSTSSVTAWQLEVEVSSSRKQPQTQYLLQHDSIILHLPNLSKKCPNHQARGEDTSSLPLTGAAILHKKGCKSADSGRRGMALGSLSLRTLSRMGMEGCSRVCPSLPGLILLFRLLIRRFFFVMYKYRIWTLSLKYRPHQPD